MKIWLIILSCLITGCHKSGFTDHTRVYVAGQRYKLPTGSKAVYWIDQQPVILPGDSVSPSFATGIAVSGNDVYVGGNYGSRAAYWKNGQLVFAANKVKNTYATSIALSGNDVYLAGNYGEQAAYWKNGQLTALGDTIPRAFAYSIVVSGTDVYAAGFVGNYAVYWKNGQRINLTDGRIQSQARGIAVSGNDVYVALQLPGNGTYVTKCWKNGQIIDLNTNSQYLQGNYPVCIAVSDGDVYIAATLDKPANTPGPFNKSFILYWKNGKAIQLTDARTYTTVTGISVVGRDVYVSGNESNGHYYLAKYWKNGHDFYLSNGSEDYAQAIVAVPE